MWFAQAIFGIIVLRATLSCSEELKGCSAAEERPIPKQLAVAQDCTVNPETNVDECEEILKSDPPNVYSFCRNSDQSDANSLKVCTFTNVFGSGYTDKTDSPIIEHEQCRSARTNGFCDRTCKDLWARGYHSTDSSNVFSYSKGRAYDCYFLTSGRPVIRKLVCSCSELATLNVTG